MRVGFGFDVHPLRENRRLILGGVEIPHPEGLFGHSDADVLIHAICDALLGAVGAEDIGSHFPDSDPSYKGINSLVLLSRVREVLEEGGADVINIDSTIVCEAPKISPYREDMVRNIALSLGVGKEKINVKATKGEGLGFIGRGEGIVAYAIACVRIKDRGQS